MSRNFHSFLCLLLLSFGTISCSQKVKQREDEIYSRHLQAHIKLTIINTPPPDDKSEMHLLLLNDGQDADQFGVKEIVDSLYRKEIIDPLIIVAIHAISNERLQEYGVSGFPDYKNNGARADKYSSFIDNEIYAFIKKKTGVRKFKTVSIAGCSLGGLSALDIAWNNADKFDKVGVFSGSFWWRDKDTSAIDYSDAINRIMLRTIQSSRKKPKLKYWFYTGGSEETGDRDKDGITDVVDDTKDLIAIIKSKNICPPGDIVYKEMAGGRHDYKTWKMVLPDFLIWAYKR